MVMSAKLEGHSKTGVQAATGLQRPSTSATVPQRNAATGSDAAVAAPAARRPMRRILTREQGRALETIGHAVDYLNDCHLYDGGDEEILNAAGPFTEALQVLIAARQEILWSLPVAEPWTLRVWNSVFRRKPRLASAPW
ncbi:MAG: hypothetical protein WA708_08300 [Acidobacteriaceae bacterium]